MPPRLAHPLRDAAPARARRQVAARAAGLPDLAAAPGWARGPRLTPGDVLACQRAVGNRAVRRLLAARRAGDAALAGLVQRDFPRDPTAQAPINWRADTKGKAPIGEGTAWSYRVWDHKETTLIVKAEVTDSKAYTALGRVRGANQLLAELGASVPRTRFIRSFEISRDDDAEAEWNEFDRLQAVLGLEGQEVGYFQVIAQAPGKSFQPISAQADEAEAIDRGEAERLQAAVQSPAFAGRLGRLVVMDAFIGNEDRIRADGFINAGNLMLSADLTPVAIDNVARFGTSGHAEKMLADLFVNPVGFATSFYGHFDVPKGLQPPLVEAFVGGIAAGREALVRLLSDGPSVAKLRAIATGNGIPTGEFDAHVAAVRKLAGAASAALAAD